MTRNILITIEYDGSGFKGWQFQPGERTVQGELEAALCRVCREKISIAGTSRTDAGVHAFGQAATFSGDFGIPTERIPVALAGSLPEDVRVLSAEEVPKDFHARFSALGKTYLYRIAESREPDIFLRNYYYLLNESADKGKMEEAAKHMIGTHDFASFRTTGGAGSEGDAVRTVTQIGITERETPGMKGNPLHTMDIRVTGDGFMYNMVRIIAGTLVEVGLGLVEPHETANIISAKDRQKAGHTAPASGLYLEKIYFDALPGAQSEEK